MSRQIPIKGIKTLKNRRRAIVAVWTALTMSLLLGFAALAVDVGYLFMVKSELQNAADSAALAGASALLDPGQLSGAISEAELIALGTDRTEQYAGKNIAGGQLVQLDSSDISIGHLSNPNDLQDTTIVEASPYNVVQVWARRSDGSLNGPVSLFFAKILGHNTASVSASATAMLDSNVSGYRPRPNSNSPFIPMSVRKALWDTEIVNQLGDDDYGYDPDTGEITNVSDGRPEISIYPEKKKVYGDDPYDGSGNFGLLNINLQNNGANAMAQQIRDGLTYEDILSISGESELRFYTDEGMAVTHIIGGTPGLKASLKDDLESRLGDVIGFFIHQSVAEQGANAEFTTVDIQFGRLMHVNLTGSPQNKVVIVQPAAYIGEDIVVDDDAPQHYTAGRLRLVR